MEWKNTDPRIDINKRADIVILRSDAEPSMAHVDTKEVYCIFTNYKDYRCISEGKEWNKSWLWNWAPHRGKYNWCEWKNTDPRLSEKDASNIIIVNACNEVSSAKIDTNGKWDVVTWVENHNFIDADEEWNQDWWWISAPK